jgi:hypothetical protein
MVPNDLSGISIRNERQVCVFISHSDISNVTYPDLVDTREYDPSDEVKSSLMDFAIPQSKISSFSSGEFVGMVADDPGQKIKLKIFHCEILNSIT